MPTNIVSSGNSKISLCTHCNPKKYLKFNFSFAKDNGEPASEDVKNLFERLRFLSEKPYSIMIFENQGDKKSFIEEIKVSQMNWTKGKRQIPVEFRENFPTETNEKYAIFRVYPAGTPNGTANPRIIGMIKNTIFYVFYFDWKGDLYSH